MLSAGSPTCVACEFKGQKSARGGESVNEARF